MRSLGEKALTLLSYWKVSYKPGLSCTKIWNVNEWRQNGSYKRLPGGGHGNPLQYFCLEKPMDSRTWGGYSP